MERTYHTNNNIVFSCIYHVIWCPKYRRPVLIDEVDKRLRQIIGDVAAKLQSEIQGMEIMPDHVHLVVEVDPQYGVHRLVKQIKGRSSHLLRQEFPHLRTQLPTLWTNSYFVSTVGDAPLAILKQYVENQKHV